MRTRRLKGEIRPNEGRTGGQLTGFCRPLLILAGTPLSLAALGTNQRSEEIPPLRPPRDLLPPTFLEQHGTALVVAAAVLLAGFSVLIWWLRRPRPAARLSPQEAVKAALFALRGRNEDLELVTNVGCHLRHFVRLALRLPESEYTTDELVAAVGGDRRVSAELTSALGRILRECETRAFAPLPPPSPPNLVDGALKIVAEFEVVTAPPASPPAEAKAIPSMTGQESEPQVSTSATETKPTPQP